MKNNTPIVALLALIIGLFVGFGLAPEASMTPQMTEEMHEEMDHMMDEEMLSADGYMQHSMDEMMRGLHGKTGEEYEKAFLEMMIVHHVGAIEMAEDLLEETERPELVKMANDIITVQTQEVDMMKEWLNDWFTS